MSRLSDPFDALRDTWARSHPVRIVLHGLVLLLYAAASYLVGRDVGWLLVGIGVFFGVVATTSPDSAGPAIVTGLIGFYTVGARDDLVHPSTLVLALLLLAAHLTCALLAVGPEPALWSRGLLARWARGAGALAGVTVAAYLLLAFSQHHPLPVRSTGFFVGAGVLAVGGWLAVRYSRPVQRSPRR